MRAVFVPLDLARCVARLATALALAGMSASAWPFPPLVKYWIPVNWETVIELQNLRFESAAAACEAVCARNTSGNLVNCVIVNPWVYERGSATCRATNIWGYPPEVYVEILPRGGQWCPNNSVWASPYTGCACNAGFTERGERCYRPDVLYQGKNVGAPKACAQGVFNPLNSGTGNKYVVETDYAGLSAFRATPAR
jgi:hypothetical protein